MKEKILELKAVIRNTGEQLDMLHSSLDELYREELQKTGKTPRAAFMVAGLIENWYTCLETALFRISQYFENSLDKEQWHKNLLDKMTLRIENVRIEAVSRETYPKLLELLKFRHFRRYYFEIDFDWDRLEFLRKKLKEAHPMVQKDLQGFADFLDSLLDF